MKRLRRTFIMVTVLLVGGFVLHLALNREPRYEGRTLTDWLETADEGLSNLADTNAAARIQAATNAIRHIGTNAIPFLMKKLTAVDTPMGARLKSWAESQPWIKFHFADPDSQRLLGEEGFIILGADAMAATPSLIRLSKNSDAELRFLAFKVLHYIHSRRETMVPILLEALKDPDDGIHSMAVLILRTEDPEAAKKAGVYETPPESRPDGTSALSTNAPGVSK